MTLSEAVIDRLKERVPALAGRVEGALDFAQLLASGQLPATTPAANVMPFGLQGGRADASAGAFRQEYTDNVAVLLTLRTAGGGAGGQIDRARDMLGELVIAVLRAIAGWAPGEEIGVLRLTRGALITARRGVLVYQIDFAIDDQLRIIG